MDGTSDDALFVACGVNGTVELTQSTVRIKRHGVLAFLTQGVKGDKEILLSEISSIQFKKAGFLNGYIQFAYRGGHENKRGIFDATTDENTVMFRIAQNEEFECMRSEIQRRLTSRVRTTCDSGIDDLEKLAQLRDHGIISEDEFKVKKKQILGLLTAVWES